MAIQVRAGGAWRTISGLQIYANGAWRNILQVQVYSGGAWRVVANYSPPEAPPAPTVSLVVSPHSAFVSGKTASLTSGTIFATPSGGVPPFTYAWSVSEADGTTVINSPTLASTTVTQRNLVSGTPAFPTIRCTATDSLGQTAADTSSITFDREA